MPVTEASRRSAGRALDARRDADIKAAVIELLAEQGYDRITMEMVAARARAGKGTIYRRWASKVELVIDAINDLKPADLALPDTGTLAGDIQAYFEKTAVEGPTDAFQLIAGLGAALTHDRELAESFHTHFVAPRVGRLQALLDRAVTRGELPPNGSADLVCAAFPAFMLHRVVFGGQPPDRDYMHRIINEVIIPLATGGTTARKKQARKERPQ